VFVFFDTETTGKAKIDLPPDHPSQPRIIQLAAALVTPEAKVVGSLQCLITPDGWTIEPQAQAVHGISLADCQSAGIPIHKALSVFDGFCWNAKAVVAHNIDFDLHLIHGEFARLQRKPALLTVLTVCTMKMATPIVKLPGKYGNFKWPKLQETHQFLFGKGFDGAHDAMADVLACMRCYFRWQRV
jgi:DNA polymerase-3 subunit epsilon